MKRWISSFLKRSESVNLLINNWSLTFGEAELGVWGLPQLNSRPKGIKTGALYLLLGTHRTPQSRFDVSNVAISAETGGSEGSALHNLTKPKHPTHDAIIMFTAFFLYKSDAKAPGQVSPIMYVAEATECSF